MVIAVPVPADDTAVSEFFRAVSRHLSESGLRTIILTPPRGSRLDLGRWGAVAHVEWPSPRPDDVRSMLFALRLLRRLRPACVIANFGATNAMVLSSFLTRVPVRVVWDHTVTAHMTSGNPTLHQRFQIVRRKLVVKMVTNHVANSGAMGNDLVETFGCAPGRISVVHNAIADPGGSILGFGERRAEPGPFGLCVARRHHEKGQDVLLEAMALTTTPLPMVFVGRDVDDGSLARKATELGVIDRCTFLPQQSYAAVMSLMRSAVVHVLPTFSEAFGLVNIEAMACGTPPIASCVGGVPEVIEDGVSGVLVPPGDAAALASALDAVVSDSVVWSRLSEGARSRFLGDFELEAAATRVAGLVQSWITAAGRGRK